VKPADLLARSRCLLVDFDGPVCAVFASHPAATVAAQLQTLIRDQLGTLPANLAELTTDPLQLLRQVAERGDPALTRAVVQACGDAEGTAVATAIPTFGGAELLAAAKAAGRWVGIVSNNATRAVETYLRRHQLDGHVDAVAARLDDMDPRQLKPQPYLVRQALALARTTPADAVLIGDSVSDVEAGHAAGIATIGYANKPGKRQRLTDAGATVVVDTMIELAEAMRTAVRASA
jgi:phosphoglycolate phosphatase